jgi:hypothetical protein
MRTTVQYLPDLPMVRGARDTADSTNLRIACLWSALGLALTGLFFAFGFGAEIGQILAVAA